MSNDLQIVSNNTLEASDSSNLKKFVSMYIDDNIFGIPVDLAQDIMRPLPITYFPLAPDDVLGSINLRGRIVTVIDLRKRLGIDQPDEDIPGMQVILEHNDELFSLKIDNVGDVMDLPIDKYEKSPPHLSDTWQEFVQGVYQLEENILVVLDIEHLLDINFVEEV